MGLIYLFIIMITVDALGFVNNPKNRGCVELKHWVMAVKQPFYQRMLALKFIVVLLFSEVIKGVL